MGDSNFSLTSWTAAGLLIAVTAAGCKQSRAGAERFAPPSDVARKALVAALDAWRDGQPPGAVAGTSPVIQVVDSHRRPDRTLASFDVLAEVPSNAPRCFAVRLRFTAPDEDQKARFVVFGIDPLWVFREDDYEMLAHWEHPMPKPSATDENQNDSQEKPDGGK